MGFLLSFVFLPIFVCVLTSKINLLEPLKISKLRLSNYTMKKIIVAVDGYSSCGKSTMAKTLAKATGYTYIDTGAMYRAVALYAIKKNLMTDKSINQVELKKQLDEIKITFKFNPESGISDTYLNEENVENEIRQLNVAQGASRVSELKFVRAAMVKQQQEMGKEKGIVMDGRDIGTVVFPNAELKLFVTASAEIRAKRRFDELQSKGDTTIKMQDVLDSIIVRDNRDIHRKESPLRQAKDAIVLDNSKMTLEEQQTWVMNQFKAHTDLNN